MMTTMLTTVDNPFDPITQYDDWETWDAQSGYHTPSFLARVVVTSPEISDEDQSLAIRTAIEEIVRENVSGMYRLVQREVSEDSGD